MFKKLNKRQGFTLIEMIIAIGIFSFVVVGITSVMMSSFRYNSIFWDQLESQNDGRRVLQEIVNTLRKAEDSSLGSYVLEKATDYEIIFYANVDEDSLKEKVRYFLDGTVIKKSVIKASGNPLNYNSQPQIVDLAHYVVNLSKTVPLFLYYDENFTGTENYLVQPINITNVRSVKIQLEIEKDAKKSPIPLHFESFVQIRNLKTN